MKGCASNNTFDFYFDFQEIGADSSVGRVGSQLYNLIEGNKICHTPSDYLVLLSYKKKLPL